jgi:DNA-binding NarL/FixJ family response regulator
MFERRIPIRVLLANENPLARCGMRRVLEHSREFEVVAETGGDLEALELIRRLEPDVAVLDIQIHHIVGIEVARAVYNNRWPVAVILSTPLDEDPNGIALLRTGPKGAALQAASPEDLLAAVRDAAHGRWLFSPAALTRVMAQVSHLDIYAEISALSEAEVEILSLLGKGLTNQDIAGRLGLSPRAVQARLAQIFDRLQVHNRTEAVSRALAIGVLQKALPASSEYVVYQN